MLTVVRFASASSRKHSPRLVAVADHVIEHHHVGLARHIEDGRFNIRHVVVLQNTTDEWALVSIYRHITLIDVAAHKERGRSEMDRNAISGPLTL